jgi:hypothetical protein
MTYFLVNGTSVLSVNRGGIAKTIAIVQITRVDNKKILATVVGLLAHVVQEGREVTKVG